MDKFLGDLETLLTTVLCEGLRKESPGENALSGVLTLLDLFRYVVDSSILTNLREVRSSPFYK